MTLKEKKRKLSEILGINVFDSRYKEIDALLEKETEADKEIEPEATEENQAEETTAEEIKAETADTEEGTENEEKQTEAETTAKGEDKEETAEGDVTEEEETKSEDDSESADGEETETQSSGEDNTETADATEGESNSMEAELFDAKLEAKLLRAGVREDKLDAAKKLFKADHTLADVEQVEKWVKEYPEWIKQKTKEQAKGFGMGVGENDTAETAEDKRLRELGII